MIFFSLHINLEHCPDRSLRSKVWDADVTKVSVFQDKVPHTSTLVEEIRYKRTRQAKLLGYDKYTDLSMETKMAGNLQNVYHTLDTLLKIGKIFTVIYQQVTNTYMSTFFFL